MGRLTVAQFFAADELLQLSLRGSSRTFYELSLEGVIGGIRRGSDKEVPDFDCELMVESSFLGCDASGAELGFDLCKLDGRIAWPEWGSLILMAATVGEEAGATTVGVSVSLVGSSGTVSIVASAVVDIVVKVTNVVVYDY